MSGQPSACESAKELELEIGTFTDTTKGEYETGKKKPPAFAAERPKNKAHGANRGNESKIS